MRLDRRRRALPLHLIVVLSIGISAAVAFTPLRPYHISRSVSCVSPLSDSPRGDKEESSKGDDGTSIVSSALTRFTSPRIDDPFLPLSDALVAQIIAPTMQIAFLASSGAARPSWLQPIFSKEQLLGNGSGSLLAPTLIHVSCRCTSLWIYEEP